LGIYASDETKTKIVNSIQRRYRKDLLPMHPIGNTPLNKSGIMRVYLDYERIADTCFCKETFFATRQSFWRDRMKPFSGKVNDDYGCEVAVISKIREFSDGITFIELVINWDRYLADHSPIFSFRMILLNHTIIEANIYYLHHRRHKTGNSDDCRKLDQK
jgi:hypothetical protein